MFFRESLNNGLFRNLSDAGKVILNAIFCILLLSGEVWADPVPAKTTLNPADRTYLETLDSKLQKKEIKQEEYIALKDQWIKGQPLPMPAPKKAGSVDAESNISGAKEGSVDAAIAAIRQSPLTSEEKIRRIDSILNSQATRRPESKVLPPTIPSDPDVKAIKNILENANRLGSEARIAEIDRQLPVLEQHSKALQEKEKSVTQSDSQKVP